MPALGRRIGVIVAIPVLALGASPAASAVRADGRAAYEDYKDNGVIDRCYSDAAFAGAKLLAHDDQLNYGAALDIITEKQVQCQRPGAYLGAALDTGGPGGAGPVWLAVGAAAVAGVGAGGGVAWSRRRNPRTDEGR